MQLEITVSKSELQNKLKAVSRVINPSNKVNPAHGNFLFEIQEEFDVTGADQSGNITATVDCHFSDPEEKLSFCVDSKTMLDGLKELPEQPLTLIFDTKKLSTEVIHQSGKYKVKTFDSETFSVAKNSGTSTKLINIKSVDFLRGIKAVYEFASNDELRPVMCGIYIQSKSAKLSFCASNSSIMAMMDFAPESLEFNDFELVMASKLAKIVIELIGKETDIELEIGEKNVSIRFGFIKIVYRLVEGKYPNYRSVIPKSNDIHGLTLPSEYVVEVAFSGMDADASNMIAVVMPFCDFFDGGGTDDIVRGLALEHYRGLQQIDRRTIDMASSGYTRVLGSGIGDTCQWPTSPDYPTGLHHARFHVARAGGFTPARWVVHAEHRCAGTASAPSVWSMSGADSPQSQLDGFTFDDIGIGVFGTGSSDMNVDIARLRIRTP